MPPLAHYKLNDDEANTDVVDSSGNGLDGVASANTENLSVAAKLNDGFNLAGTHYVTLPDGTSTGLGGASGVTFFVWVKRSAISSRMILVNLNVNTSSTKFAVEFQADNTLQVLARSTYPETAQTRATVETYTDTSSWHLIAVTVDLATDTILIYWDGELQTMSGSPSFAQTTFSAAVGNAGTLGSYAALYKYNGIVDETRLYAAALTGGQIKRLYNAGYGTEDSMEKLYAENDGPLRPVLRS